MSSPHAESRNAARSAGVSRSSADAKSDRSCARSTREGPYAGESALPDSTRNRRAIRLMTTVRFAGGVKFTEVWRVAALPQSDLSAVIPRKRLRRLRPHGVGLVDAPGRFVERNETLACHKHAVRAIGGIV